MDRFGGHVKLAGESFPPFVGIQGQWTGCSLILTGFHHCQPTSMSKASNVEKSANCTRISFAAKREFLAMQARGIDMKEPSDARCTAMHIIAHASNLNANFTASRVNFIEGCMT